MKKKYISEIVGDGKTPETAFRPYIPNLANKNDVNFSHIRDLGNGKMEFEADTDLATHAVIKLDNKITEKI